MVTIGRSVRRMSLVLLLLWLTACTSLPIATQTPGTEQEPTTVPMAPEDPLAGTEWTLVSLGAPGAETPVVLGSEVTLQFDAQGHAGGSAGCNSYGGSYQVQDGMLSFGEVVSTMMACAEEGIMQQEQQYLSALGTTGEYEIVADQLVISYNDGQEALTFTMGLPAPTETPTTAAGTPVAENPLAGTEWALVSFGASGTETSLVAGSEITLSFDAQGRAGGSASCNSYGSDYEVQDGSLSFGPAASTKMACAGEGIMQQEQQYLAALEAAGEYELTADRLVITYGDDQETLTFAKGLPMPTGTPTASATAVSSEPPTATAVVATDSPVEPQPAYLDNRSTPENLMQSLVNAINRKEYLRAYSYWRDPAAFLGTFEDFEAGYADTASVELATGEVTADAGAGQWYYSIPVVLTAQMTDGTIQVYSGCYDLHLSNPAIQATPPFVPLGIRSAVVEPVAADADPTEFLARACRAK